MTDIPPGARGPLVALIAALRADWGKPGITKALEKLNAEPDLTTEQRLIYAIRAACNDELTTPEGMNLAGKHRTGDIEEATRYPVSRCQHLQPWTTCTECHKPRETVSPERAAELAAAIKARGGATLHTSPGRLRK